MPAVPDWSPQFDLTNPYNGLLSFNVQTDSGLYLLDTAGCDFQETVRSTTDDVPQSDGAILHHRFLKGTQMVFLVELWEDSETVACDAVLATMLDDLSGATRSLLNAGDNEGRMAWPVAGKAQRMLDDVRLLVYAKYTAAVAQPTVVFTIDSQYPYAQDLTQTETDISDGGTVTLANDGSADYWPVFQVYGPGHGSTSAFTLTNLTTGIQFVYNAALPGAHPIGATHYAEIDTFRNTIFLDGSIANLKAGVDQLSSDYMALVVGDNDIEITGGDVRVLWAPAWG